MHIRKAVVTAAGRDQRGLPLQTLVDRDGVEKKALKIIVEEAIRAGIEEVALVIAPSDEPAYREAAAPHGPHLHFIEQAEPRGYGHALLLAKDFTAGQPFLHMVGDHVFLSATDRRAAEQVVEAAKREECGVSAVQPTRESLLSLYGTVAGRRVPRSADLVEIETIVEKPTPSEAEQFLFMPGLRAGTYLCLFGIHVFRPALMEILAARFRALKPGESLGLTPALADLAKQERYLALEVKGRRFNIGVKYGLLQAQLALALAGDDRDQVLSLLVELLAHRSA